MSPFKSLAVKGGSKGKELVIDVDDPSPRSKRTRFSTEVNDPDLFRSYAAFQNYTTYFRDAPLLVERIIDQSSLLDRIFQYGLPPKIGSFFSQILRMHMKT